MPQLRDAQTSQILLEGTPLQVALAARELGYDEVLFDDLPPAFDPDAVIAAQDELVAGMKGAIKETKPGSDDRQAIQDQIDEHADQTKAAVKLTQEATAALQDARQTLDDYED